MAEEVVEEKPTVEKKEYRWTGAFDVVLTRSEAGKVQALLNAGVSRVGVIRRGLEVLLEKPAEEILKVLGLAEMLEKPELVVLDKYEFKKIEVEEGVKTE